jgi:hypothetical protein
LGGTRAWTREESSRLARIAIDLPSSLDSDWRIDVRKSHARPPGPMRERLTTLSALCRDKAREVFAWRGQRAQGQPSRGDAQPIWISAPASSASRYRINREHPLIVNILRNADANAAELDAMLTLIERSVPVERIWLDVSEAEGVAAPSLSPAEINVLTEQLARIGRTLPPDMSAEDRAHQLTRHLPGNTEALKTALLKTLKSTA